MIAYLLDVSLCWLIFYLLYYVWLSKETFFDLNRWYLLGTLFLGLIIPVMPSPFGAEVQESEWVTLYVAPITTTLESLQITVTATQEVEESFDWWQLLVWSYWIGLAFFAFRFLSGLWRIGQMYHRAEHIRVGRYRVALTNEPHLPFSFFQVVFKSKLGQLDEFAEQKITDHELAHVRGWHTIDVLLVELVSILLWCSPPVHLYRRSLRIVHEYIADSAAIRTGQKKKYGHLLIRQSQSGLQLALANHFIQSQLKKRILMMTKTRSRRQAFLKYLPAIPLLVVALVVFSNWEAIANVNNNGTDRIELTASEMSEDFDPVVLKKQLNDILEKRKWATTNQDAKLALGFAAVHDKWVAKYPEHREEIRQIAQTVADKQELFLDIANNQVVTAYFKKPFAPAEQKPAVKISSPDLPASSTLDFNTSEVKIEGLDQNPYVLINGEPAPADWKSQLLPEIIKSISVLKGDAAVKAYGEKARDGAILITTIDVAPMERTLPLFPGCDDLDDAGERETCSQKRLIEHVFSNLRYPKDSEVEGMVVAGYVIGKDGKVRDIEILKSLGKAFDQEVIRVLSSMPVMVPGTMDGIPTATEMKLPVKFKAPSKPAAFENKEAAAAKGVITNIRSTMGEPLFIVDGEILEQGAIREIDPNSIDRIDVLKGEQAIEAYGDKGANGVVRIFTKMRRYDTAPIFPGCEGLEGEEQVKCSQKNFLMNVYKNITYPASARNKNIEGLIVVTYTISKSGKVQNARIQRGVDPALDAEVLRVIKELPDWTPATKDGKPVAVDLTLPVKYNIENESQRSKNDRMTSGERTDEKTYIEQLAKNSDVLDKVVVVGYGNPAAGQEPLRVAEEMPRFPGCEDVADKQERAQCAINEVVRYVYDHLEYTKEAKKAGVQGTIIASFVVAKDGSLRDIKIERGLGYGLDEQVLDVIYGMPKWTPGRHLGQTVEVIYNLPVRFVLDMADKLGKAKSQPPVTDRELPVTPATNTLELKRFQAAPNPSQGLINLRFQSTAQPLSVRILSPNGQLVYEQQFPQFDGNFDQQINLQDAPKGTLFITVQQGDKLYNSTILLQ